MIEVHLNDDNIKFKYRITLWSSWILSIKLSIAMYCYFKIGFLWKKKFNSSNSTKIAEKRPLVQRERERDHYSYLQLKYLLMTYEGKISNFMFYMGTSSGNFGCEHKILENSNFDVNVYYCIILFYDIRV